MDLTQKIMLIAIGIAVGLMVTLILISTRREVESSTMLTDERLAAISNTARQQCRVFGAPVNSPAMSQCVGIFLAGWMERDRLNAR